MCAVYRPNGSVDVLNTICEPWSTLISALPNGWPLALSVTTPLISELTDPCTGPATAFTGVRRKMDPVEISAANNAPPAQANERNIEITPGERTLPHGAHPEAIGSVTANRSESMTDVAVGHALAGWRIHRPAGFRCVGAPETARREATSGGRGSARTAGGEATFDRWTTGGRRSRCDNPATYDGHRRSIGFRGGGAR